jgi:hypothetical protein
MFLIDKYGTFISKENELNNFICSFGEKENIISYFVRKLNK